ncbi:MAG: Asp23/Gls24 family envelope stress response protein [Mycobacterium sp.]
MVDDDPGTRGSLTVRNRAVERLSARAALETDGVQQFRRGVDKLTGRELPKISVVVSGDHVRASVEIAIEWGRPLAATTAAVRSRIAQALSTMGGLTVDGVDVHVAGVVPETSATQRTLQ